MARPVDPTRLATTLAKALETSPRMLLYDFGSKDRLIHEILAEIRRRETALFGTEVRSLDDVWRWIAAPEHEPFLRLFFEIYVDALGRDEAQPLVRDWLSYLQERWTPPVDAATATLMIAVVRGLLLDRLATGDRARTDAAFTRFAELEAKSTGSWGRSRRRRGQPGG